MKRIRLYYELTKPGIVYGNALTAAAGFVLASHGHIDWTLLILTLVGISGIIAAACVCNNYYDREIDARMERTKHRALAAGAASARAALIFGCALLATGCALLLVVHALLALGVALFGFAVYVFLYSPLKHRTGYALYVGAVAGAVPPVAGYAAVKGVLDIAALELFIFLFLWQIFHFLAIAAYRYDEYAAAGVPLLVRRPKTERSKQIARSLFYLSLVVLLLWCVALMLQR
jgi:heme o synthase